MARVSAPALLISLISISFSLFSLIMYGDHLFALLSLSTIAGELNEGFAIQLFVCFLSQHAPGMEAAILDAACQCLCVDFISIHSGS